MVSQMLIAFNKLELHAWTDYNNHSYNLVRPSTDWTPLPNTKGLFLARVMTRDPSVGALWYAESDRGMAMGWKFESVSTINYWMRSTVRIPKLVWKCPSWVRRTKLSRVKPIMQNVGTATSASKKTLWLERFLTMQSTRDISNSFDISGWTKNMRYADVEADWKCFLHGNEKVQSQVWDQRTSICCGLAQTQDRRHTRSVRPRNA